MIENRIKQLIEMLNLTYSEFAEEVGVQPSSISHLISGRNKPSLDFIEKVHKKYPDLEMNWLLFGQGFPFTHSKSTSQNSTPTLFLEDNESLSDDNQISSEKYNSSESSKQEVDTVQNAMRDSQRPQKKIEKIVWFYLDGTFEEFHSKND